MTNENHNDEKTKSTNGKDVLWVLVGLVVVFFVLGIVGFAKWIGVGPELQSSREVGLNFYNRLGHLPTEPWLYVLFVALIGGYLTWKWVRYNRLLNEFTEKEQDEKEKEETKDGLTRRDWWIAREFRKRAFILRVQSDLLLGSVFVLLVGGLYLLTFVLPVALESDPFVARRAHFVGQFGQSLQSLVDGRYWLKTDAKKGSNADKEPETKHKSASRTMPGHQSQSSSEGSLQLNEKITAAALSADGKTGLVGEASGSVVLTTDGGKTWKTLADLQVQDGEKITAAALSADGKAGLVGDASGSVVLTTDGGKTWKPLANLPVQDGEKITAAALSADGKAGLVGDASGSVVLTTDGGKTWKPLANLPVEEKEWIIAAAFNADGQTGLARGFYGSVVLTTDGGKTWKTLADLPLQDGEEIAAATFGADGQTGLVGGRSGSVVLTTDGGKKWRKLADLPVQDGEKITAAALSADGKSGLVVGDKGLAYLTTDSGANWYPTEGLDRSPSFVDASALKSSRGFIALTKDRDYYGLKPHPELKDWHGWSISKIQRTMTNHKAIQGSPIFGEISKFIGTPVDSYTGAKHKINEPVSGVLDSIDSLAVMRLATMTILFFLVQILVRLYQYNLRLSAFWDSRSDAMFLANTFAEDKAERFDDLVRALGPDAYDFKSPPQSSPVDWLRARSKS